jgi:hypothetical protein
MDVEQRIRTEGRLDTLVGQLVSRVRVILTIQDQNLFGLFWLLGPQGLKAGVTTAGRQRGAQPGQAGTKFEFRSTKFETVLAAI